MSLLTFMSLLPDPMMMPRIIPKANMPQEKSFCMMIQAKAMRIVKSGCGNSQCNALVSTSMVLLFLVVLFLFRFAQFARRTQNGGNVWFRCVELCLSSILVTLLRTSCTWTRNWSVTMSQADMSHMVSVFLSVVLCPA